MKWPQAVEEWTTQMNKHKKKGNASGQKPFSQNKNKVFKNQLTILHSQQINSLNITQSTNKLTVNKSTHSQQFNSLSTNQLTVYTVNKSTHWTLRSPQINSLS